MNSIDFIIILLLIWGAIIGFIKGFVIQSITLVALILGVWGGLHFSNLVTDFLGTHYDLKGKMVPIISFAIIFILILVIMYFIGKLLNTIINSTVMGVFNRIGGIVFGVLKMIFIISICIAIMAKFDSKEKLIGKEDKDQSKLYSPIAKVAPAIFPFLHFEDIKKRLLNG